MDQALRRLVETKDETINAIVREAIAKYLDRHDMTVDEVHPKWGGPRTTG
jgi:predicted transcriptional regulator